MPVLDEEAVKAAIAAGSIGGFSVDTSVFDRHRCNLDAKVLQSLSQFRGTSIHLVLSEIVAGEVKRHIERNVDEAGSRLKAALGLIRKSWRRPVDQAAVHEVRGIRETSAEFAGRSMSEFADAVGAEIIAVDGLVAHSEVLRRYFGAEPPFSHGEPKKNEFPDALALLSLEAWVRRNETLVLVVSQDRDWQSFADASEHLICVPDLAVALDHFNAAAAFVVARCMTLLAQGEASELKVDIEGAIEIFLENFDPEIDAYSTLDYELDYLEPALQHWMPDPDAGPKIVQAGEEVVVFVVPIRAIVNFSATFRYSVHDSVDRDIVDLGTDVKQVEETISLQAVISIDRRIEEEPDVRSVEIDSRLVTITFGSVDPDWGYEE
jgi:hypothetical protein